MSCLDSSARLKSVTDATPYSKSKSEITSVADTDQGSGIQDPVPYWSLDPWSGIQDQDPRALKPIFWFKILKFFDLDPGP